MFINNFKHLGKKCLLYGIRGETYEKLMFWFFMGGGGTNILETADLSGVTNQLLIIPRSHQEKY